MARVKIATEVPERPSADTEIARLRDFDAEALRARWEAAHGKKGPSHLPRQLLFRVLAYRLQADRLGDLDAESRHILDQSNSPEQASLRAADANRRANTIRPGTVLGREWNGQMHRVAVMAEALHGTVPHTRACPGWPLRSRAHVGTDQSSLGCVTAYHRGTGKIMTAKKAQVVRCAIYTRVSTDQGLDQEFNSLDAQYEASKAYIRSQVHAGWVQIKTRYDDGGFSGGNTDRPALQQLLSDVQSGKIDIIVVYKVDRLTRSLADFARLVELFDAQETQR